MVNGKNIYKSKKYYSLTHPQVSLDFSTAWTANHLTVIKNIFPQIKNYKHKKVLEIGSSYGGFINNLNKEGFSDVTASDMDKSLLSSNIKNKFIYLDILNIKNLKDKYDVIFAFNVLEHIAEDELVVKNVFHLLSKNGLFIFSVPYPRLLNIYDPYHINIQYPNYWTNLFHRNGFVLLKVEEITFLPFIWRYVKLPFFFKKPMNIKIFTSEIFYVLKKS